MIAFLSSSGAGNPIVGTRVFPEAAVLAAPERVGHEANSGAG
jgi:hypothetical protein